VYSDKKLYLCSLNIAIIAAMRKILLIILWAVAGSLSLCAQSAQQADQEFNQGHYAAAKEIYAQLLVQSPQFPLYLYRYARCAQETGDISTAITYFLRSGDKYALTHFYLGELYTQLWRIDEAKAEYELYLSALSAPNERVLYIQARMRQGERIARMLRHVQEVCVIGYTELLRQDLLTAYPVTQLKMDAEGKVSYTTQRGDRQLMTIDHMGTHLLVSRQRLLENWTGCDTLSPVVNFNATVNYPYLLSDGVTLYFAAEDSLGLGGMDLYISRYNTTNNTWTQPTLLDCPFNSAANDYMLVIDEANDVGYFATDRFSDSAHVRVYSFALAETKQYLHDLEPDSLIAMAQLRSYCVAETKQDKAAVSSHDEQEKEIYLVLNDHTLYTSWSDFRHPEAAQEYRHYLQLQRQYESAQHQLDLLRQQYSRADATTRQQLNLTILSVETQLDTLPDEISRSLSSVRQLEAQQ